MQTDNSITEAAFLHLLECPEVQVSQAAAKITGSWLCGRMIEVIKDGRTRTLTQLADVCLCTKAQAVGAIQKLTDSGLIEKAASGFYGFERGHPVRPASEYVLTPLGKRCVGMEANADGQTQTADTETKRLTKSDRQKAEELAEMYGVKVNQRWIEETTFQAILQTIPQAHRQLIIKLKEGGMQT